MHAAAFVTVWPFWPSFYKKMKSPPLYFYEFTRNNKCGGAKGPFTKVVKPRERAD